MNRQNENEKWISVPGYEGLYEVSDMGRVRATPHLRRGANWKRPSGYIFMTKGRMLKQHLKKNGYLQVILYKNGKSRTYTVHRLVMLAFVGESVLTVNHKNQIKTDNRLSNLEYMTAAQNIRYSCARPVECFELSTNKTVKVYGAGIDVREDGFDVGAVNNCCRGVDGYFSHHGYGWRYSDVRSA